MQIEQEVKLDFDDVLIRPKRSEMGSRADVELTRTFKMLNSEVELTGIGIIASNMDTIGTFSMCQSLSEFQIFTCLHKFYPPEKLIDFFKTSISQYAFYTLGITEVDIDKLKMVSSSVPINKICLDIANGYTKFFVEKAKLIRGMFPKAIIMAGNVATPEMVQELLISGEVDIVKVGIGPGKVCQTRSVTGVGYCQLAAVIECADAAHGLGGYICSDGGCSKSGDICKAFGGGTDFTMLGFLLAGHDECEGEWEEEYVWTRTEDGVPKLQDTHTKIKTSLKFYGMSSSFAMDKYYGGMAEYRAAEGECIKVPYKGPVKHTIQQILGGIRSACTYIGADKLKDFSKCTTFIKCK
jgi:GMP reductase